MNRTCGVLFLCRSEIAPEALRDLPDWAIAETLLATAKDGAS